MLAGASIAALTLAAPAIAQDDPAASAQAAPAADMPVMTFGEWGFDPETINPAVDPGDDFFAYANSKWIAENTIPADKSRFGAFDVLNEKSRADVRALMDEITSADNVPGSAADRLARVYNAYLDTDAIDEAGIEATWPYTNRIFEASSLEQLATLMAEPGYPSLIGAGVGVDSKAPDEHIVSIGFSGMGLPDRDYYLVDSERNETIRAAYMDYLTFLMGQLRYEDPAQAAAGVYQFEKQVAQLEWDRTAIRNADLTYNKLTRDELMAATGDFPMGAILSQLGLSDVDYVQVSQMPPTDEEIEALGLTPEYLEGIGGGLPAMASLLANTPLATIKAYMAKTFLSSNASVLPSEIDQAQFDFYGKVLSGAQEQEPRWKRAISATQGSLGEQLGKLYVDRYFPQESKAAMDDLVANLREALRRSIAENDWMTEETKVQAYAKLDSFNPKVGYPDSFETYEGLNVTDDPLANRMAVAAWAQADNLSELGQPVDKTEWFMLPQTVNAYYNPTFNEIVFPAAILQQPFFAASNDPAVNYGGIGGVIGHEMGHGFDDQGSKYDSTGTLKNWWQESDLARFTELGDALAAQYDSYCPYDDGETCVNGRFTLGENIGDVGGLSMAYRAYKIATEGKEVPVIDGLTGDQRFFLAWAQVWRSMQREEMGRQRLQTDPHSPEEFRVNGAVRNMDAWYEAFGVTPDDELYLAPEDRVRIW
jgi:putative endopeptidase